MNSVAGLAGTVNGAGDTRCGGQQIRGFDVTSSVYRDGLRLPGTSQANFNCLDAYGAERIEVLKGPASVLYGQNGPGGVINYVSKRPLAVPFGEVAVAGGDFSRTFGPFDVGVKYQPPGFNGYVTVAAFDLLRQNVIRFDPFTSQARQTGAIASHGVELEGVVSVAEGLNVRAAYAYIDAEITRDPDGGNQGTVPTTVPRHRFSIWSDDTVQGGDRRGITMGGGLRFVGSTFGRRRQHLRGTGGDGVRQRAQLHPRQPPPVAQRDEPVRHALRRHLFQCGFRLRLRGGAAADRAAELSLVAAASCLPHRPPAAPSRSDGGPPVTGCRARCL